MLSFGAFVDDALFHPRWGYYATGAVRFGEGGHYDTFPTALSPLFGRMVAGAARRFGDRRTRPAIDVCEIGAGTGSSALTMSRAWSRAQEPGGERSRARFAIA
jgi:SAM-dependent MidA family methyltransferase